MGTVDEEWDDGSCIVNHLVSLKDMRRIDPGIEILDIDQQYHSVRFLDTDVTLCGAGLLDSNYDEEAEPGVSHLVCTPKHIALCMTNREMREEEPQAICSECKAHPDFDAIIGPYVLQFME